MLVQCYMYMSKAIILKMDAAIQTTHPFGDDRQLTANNLHPTVETSIYKKNEKGSIRSWSNTKYKMASHDEQSQLNNKNHQASSGAEINSLQGTKYMCTLIYNLAKVHRH